MPFGLPNISYLGYPLSLPCAGHAGLGFREARRADAPDVQAHFARLGPGDRRMRFCATLGEEALARHVTGIWDRAAFVLIARDGPLWPTPLLPAGPIRGLAEISLARDAAEIGISVDATLRRRGVGTYLTQTAGRLLAARGISALRAYTLAGNRSMIALGRACAARIDHADGEVEITFSTAALRRAYLRRRATDFLHETA